MTLKLVLAGRFVVNLYKDKTPILRVFCVASDHGHRGISENTSHGICDTVEIVISEKPGNLEFNGSYRLQLLD